MTASDNPNNPEIEDVLTTEARLTDDQGIDKDAKNPDWQEPDDATDDEDRLGELGDIDGTDSETTRSSQDGTSLDPHEDELVALDKRIEREELSDTDWAGYTDADIQPVLEAAMFAYGKPLSVEQMVLLFQDHEAVPSKRCIRFCLQLLSDWYADRGVQLTQVRSGYRFQTAPDYGTKIQSLWDERPGKYSRATLETLSLIAYRQPITRGEIEDVRGVSVSSQIIRAMLERQWIRVVGHRDVPGRPALFGTTKEFLDYFGLASLSQLPSLAEIREFDDLSPELDFDETEQVEGADASGSVSDDFGFNEPYDGLAGLEDDLARDLASSSAVNDQFEALLAAEHEAAQAPDLLADLDSPSGSAEDSVADYDNLESAPLTEREQQRIIEEKLAMQKALLEQTDKEDNHD